MYLFIYNMYNTQDKCIIMYMINNNVQIARVNNII